MRLKLDDDKYVLAEQDTLMNIVAEGNDENARTFIDSSAFSGSDSCAFEVFTTTSRPGFIPLCASSSM